MDAVISGHKKAGAIQLKAWLHTGEALVLSPPVRVSRRAGVANSWDKNPEALRRYHKYTALKREGQGWEFVEVDVRAEQWAYFGNNSNENPKHTLVFMVPPRGESAYYVGEHTSCHDHRAGQII